MNQTTRQRADDHENRQQGKLFGCKTAALAMIGLILPFPIIKKKTDKLT
jgi:hypothetical protein